MCQLLENETIVCLFDEFLLLLLLFYANCTYSIAAKLHVQHDQ